MRSSIPSEHLEQVTLVNWFDQTYIELKGRLFSIPNGAHLAGSIAQRAKQVNKLKAEGMQTGVPDLCLPVPNSAFHGLFIEMKRQKGGTLSEDQEKWIEYLNSVGYQAVVCKGFLEAKEVIECYLSDTTSTTKIG